MYHYLRNPKTTNECRQAEKSPVKIRAKRNWANLPNAWDDIPHARRGRNDQHKNHRRK